MSEPTPVAAPEPAPTPALAPRGGSRPKRWVLVAVLVGAVVVLGAVIAFGRWWMGRSDQPVAGASTDATTLPPSETNDATTAVFGPVMEGGEPATDDQLNRSATLMADRLAAMGYSDATADVQPDGTIKIAIPAEQHVPASTWSDLGAAGHFSFRPVLQALVPGRITPKTSASEGGSPGAGEGTNAGDGRLDPPSDPTSQDWVTDELLAQAYELDCADPAHRPGEESDARNPDVAIVACSQDGDVKYVLGPVAVEGANVSRAASDRKSIDQTGSDEWIVNVQFNEQGRRQFADITKRLATYAMGTDSATSTSTQSQFAIVLDSLVISAPSVASEIPGGSAYIEGNFTKESAAALAAKLDTGALPVGFTLLSEDRATR